MQYALYKGEKLVIIGSIKEIALNREVKESTIRWYKTPSARKRDKGNSFILVKID